LPSFSVSSITSLDVMLYLFGCTATPSAISTRLVITHVLFCDQMLFFHDGYYYF
jgi:hypothetical protein